ncbi:MAG: DUF4367 domain-containing protein [Ruminiclostridium sp.]|nr:DUF4367 domain-containing protein [Ruminiclostridium sp.]
MKREEELQLEYEDILFKIMMDRVAQAEGAQMLEENQHLLEIPDAEVPQAIQQHAYKTIQTAFTKKKPQRRHTGTLRKGLRVAVVAVILLSLLMGATFAAFPNVRAKVINTIKNIYETHTDFTYQTDAEAPKDLEINVGWLPDGFYIREEGSISNHSWEDYEDNQGNVIMIEKSLPIGTSSIDTEDANIISTTMHGFEATLITKNKEARILWLDTEKNIVYFVNTEGLSIETMLKIAESIA